jgi:hypothetical protein
LTLEIVAFSFTLAIADLPRGKAAEEDDEDESAKAPDVGKF